MRPPSVPIVSPLTSHWPHRLAVLLAMVTFPLIWVGGLVTTYDAGMAVPDWPGTYGYNLFLYPYTTWISGPWDLFIEHGHRLLGALAGLVTIGLLAAELRWDTRRSARYLAAFLLAAVIVQGSLGGARVLLDERQLAMLHGCLGPVFFGLAVAMIAVTSSYWCDQGHTVVARRPGISRGLAIATVVLVLCQLVLGALLRHVSPSASTGYFRYTVFAHLIIAALLLVQVGLLWRFTPRAADGSGRLLRWPVFGLTLLVPSQILLGCGTWVVNYYYPGWVPDWELAVRYTTVEAKGFLQMSTATAHQAMGTLVLGFSVWLMMRVCRLVFPQPAPPIVAGAKRK